MHHRIKAALLATGLLGAGAVAGGSAALAFQGHMFAAQSDLQRAANQLNMAIPDKAGHRVQAIGLVNQAIGQVQAGIAAGAR